MPFDAHCMFILIHFINFSSLISITKHDVFGIYGCGKGNRIHSNLQKKHKTTSNRLFFQTTGKYNWSIKYITAVPGIHCRRLTHSAILLLHSDNAQLRKTNIKNGTNTKINKDTKLNVT